MLAIKAKGKKAHFTLPCLSSLLASGDCSREHTKRALSLLQTKPTSVCQAPTNEMAEQSGASQACYKKGRF
jgi:hypothetical protein